VTSYHGRVAGKRHNSICLKPESGIKERGIRGKKQKGIWQNRKEAERKEAKKNLA
jgi:hypothetical protein